MEIYIVFTDTKTNLAKMIKNCTRYPFSHVSLSFTKDLSQMYSFGRKDTDNAFIAGFVKEDVRDHLFQRADCAVCKLDMTQQEYERIWAYVQKMEREKDSFKYNFTGLFAVALNYNFNRKNAYFCSQFVTEALAAGDIWLAEKPPALMTPRDIFSSDSMEMIYRGDMRNYPHLEPITDYVLTPRLLEAVQ
ncbi:hypothetical protein [Planomicrobium sp. Y74]|uniref:hypothetical protein n=1 Tax=Planomicrobium sp. Y74 TaxID=2478977 RepID=UPI000EF52ADC|nr:hypothetical protein [Planomicrobium sp. Y74]RLQ83864.1 hypothetical protein D9754_17655 [Planomicrobium sp. Y74]